MRQSISMDVWMRRLEEEKLAILAEVRAWPADLQVARPAAGKWSALQVLDHLVRTEAGITTAAKEQLSKPQRIGVRDRAGFLFVERVFRSRCRVQMPRSVAQVITPGEELELGEIAARWERARAQLAELVCEAEGCRGGVFRHPVGGWMNFEQVLRFFSVHLVHHRYQLERIRSSLAGATSQSR